MAQVAADHDEAPAGRGLVVGDMNEPLYDAVNRLLALLDDPNAIAVLAPYVEREIYYRLLTSDQVPVCVRLRPPAVRATACRGRSSGCGPITTSRFGSTIWRRRYK